MFLTEDENKPTHEYYIYLFLHENDDDGNNKCFYSGIYMLFPHLVDPPPFAYYYYTLVADGGASLVMLLLMSIMIMITSRRRMNS